MKVILVVGVLVSLGAGVALAQQSLVGKYTGTIEARERGSTVTLGLVLEIQSAEGNVVKATAQRSAGSTQATRPCAGNYELEGTVAGDKLQLKSTKAPLADCAMNFTVVVEGNKLNGKMGSNAITLSK